MEFQKIENLLDSTPIQPSKFRTIHWVEVNDESRGTYTSNDIKFKTAMLRSNLCDYADAYILVNGRITITGAGDDGAARRADERDKGVTFKNCAPFTKCISRINNTDIDNAQDIDIVMSMYNLIEYSDNYSKISGSLWLYHKDEPNNNLADSESFKRTISWNKFESNIKTFERNRYLNHLINPSFQGVNRHFVLSFDNEDDRKSHLTYYLPKVE